LGKIKKSDTAEDNRYTRAARDFKSWIDRGILVHDRADAIYVYSQDYKYGGRKMVRTGFIALMELDLGDKIRVLPHENTLAAPKADRLNLMRSVKANLSPIFVLYDDERHKIARLLKAFCSKVKPFIDIKYDGERNRVWRLDDEHLIDEIGHFMKTKDIFIADGHHRYETARTYALECQGKDAPQELKKRSKFLMTYFVESDERMLTILPAHRLIKDLSPITKEDAIERLKKFFEVKRVATLKSCMSALGRFKDRTAFGMYMGKGEHYLLKLRDRRAPEDAIKNNSRDWKRLDVSILHLFLLEHVLSIRDDEENIEYVKEGGEAVRLVDKGIFKIAFFLNPTKVSQVKAIARRGEKMPRKATYFYPKPLSGLVINELTTNN
jgi:uncharacterized protein (DUF1015 family)